MSTEHIALGLLWNCRKHSNKLPPLEQSHISGCAHCNTVLFLCNQSKTVEEAERRYRIFVINRSMKDRCPEKTTLILNFKRAASEYANAVTELEREIRGISPHSKTKSFAEEAHVELRRCGDGLRTHTDEHGC